MRLPEESLELAPGTWLLMLPESADGRVVCLDAPLTAGQADPLTNPQALTALTAYRSLEQAVEEDWGLQVEHVDHNPPFRLIQCPLCDGTEFVTVGFAGVWCDRCQAEFHVRHTAGDPGFVVDCTWAPYRPKAISPIHKLTEACRLLDAARERPSDGTLATAVQQALAAMAHILAAEGQPTGDLPILWDNAHVGDVVGPPGMGQFRVIARRLRPKWRAKRLLTHVPGSQLWLDGARCWAVLVPVSETPAD